MSDSRPPWHAAASLAARAHEHQVRKDDRTPYIAHPGRVALILAARFGITDEDVLAAGWLHDTIEDCGTDYDDIAEEFGSDVAAYVAAMTKDMRLPEAEREHAYDAQLADGPWQARALKLADVLDNLSDATDGGDLVKLMGKARRALKLAAGDAQLAGARTIVEQCLQEAETRLAAAAGR